MFKKKKEDKPTNFDVMFNRVTEIFHNVEQKTYLCSFFKKKKKKIVLKHSTIRRFAGNSLL